MPAGKYSFYLHTDDRIDMLAAGILETVSQPMRGDFLRTAAIAGGVLYRIDVRLPALLTEVFDGQLTAGQLTCLIQALSGQYSTLSEQKDQVLPGIVARVLHGDKKAERRRFTLQFPEGEEARITSALLERTSSRLRGQLLRNIIIAGCALYSMDARFPRLLASLPVPPANLSELQKLVEQVTGTQHAQTTVETTLQEASVPVEPVKIEASDKLRKNMKKLF